LSGVNSLWAVTMEAIQTGRAINKIFILFLIMFLSCFKLTTGKTVPGSIPD
jgi:hypothetical protein